MDQVKKSENETSTPTELERQTSNLEKLKFEISQEMGIKRITNINKS